MAACLVACAVFIAPSGQAHPEECLSGGATWTSLAGFDEEKFLSSDGGCLPAAVTDRYDDSGAQLEAGDVVENGLELLANEPKAAAFGGTANLNSDLAFWGDLAFQGNYAGFQIFDISDPADPAVVSTVLCPGSQNDISVWNDLLFLSTDSSRSDDSCNSVGQDASIKSSWEGIKIFDVSDPAAPRYIKSVETKCGSHTHTLVPDEANERALLYVSSYSPNATFPDCQPPHDIISIVEVPLAAPTTASVIAEPNLFPDGGYDGANGYTRVTSGCHDITVYPALDLAAGACMGNGLIMDISDPANPEVQAEIFDENFAFWHSATISNDGDKVLFTDERGGGSGAECNPTVGPTKGADAVYDIRDRSNPRFLSYWKMPRTQANSENCVAHNGNLIPAPGKDIMVQAWYQGGISVIDWTNGKKVKELAYFDRGPFAEAVPPGPLAGAWSSYWYNGKVYSNEIQRGFDVLELTAPARANTKGTLPYLNAQTQEPLP